MIQKLKLLQFRSFKEKLLSFSPSITCVVGPNASGKTNILESLYLLSTGKSFHAHLEEEMVGYDQEIARVVGIVLDGRIDDTESSTSEVKSENTSEVSANLEVILTRGQIDIGKSTLEKVARK